MMRINGTNITNLLRSIRKVNRSWIDLSEGRDMDIYDNLDFEPEELISKPISKLYSLQPIGLNTEYVESLTSYITRLSKAHCVKTGSMFTNIFFPYLNKHYMVKGGRGFYTSAHIINGVSSVANEFAEMISDLTGITSIDKLTLLRFKGVIPTRGLYRSHKAWCPRCFDEMRLRREDVFEPLAWALRPVKACLRHQINLQRSCPNCNCEILLLDGRSAPGYCSKCSGWLGVENSEWNEVLATEWDIYRTKLIHELLSSDLMINVSTDVQYALSRLVSQHTGGNVSEFARYLEVPKTTFWGWYTGKNLPTLDDAIRICNKCDVTLTEFYSGNTSVTNNKFVIAGKRLKKQNVCLTSKPIPEVGRKFKLIVMDRLNMQINVTRMAHELGCNKKTLYKYFCPLCKLQTRLNQYYKAGQKGLRITRLNGEVAKVVTEISESGQTPTVQMVEKALSRPNVLREKEVKKFYEELRAVN
jgi:DNA-binding XRE family transcriptional regulator